MNINMKELNLSEMELVNGGSNGLLPGEIPAVPAVAIPGLPVGLFSAELIARLTNGEQTAK